MGHRIEIYDVKDINLEIKLCLVMLEFIKS